MINPVPNTPDNAWYKRQNHNRIPMMAESKAFLDAAYASQGPSTGAPPDEFADDDWSISNAYAAGGQGIILTIIRLPFNHGLPITDIEVINYTGTGEWALTGITAPGDYPLTVATPAGVAVSGSLRAVNSAGAGAPAAAKSVTPTAPTAPATLALDQWTVVDHPGPNANQVQITILEYPNANGEPITGFSQRSNRGAGLGGWYGFGLPALNVPTTVILTSPASPGTTYGVVTRCANAVGNSGQSSSKTVTCTPSEAPSNVTAPAITGVPQVGAILSSDAGLFSGYIETLVYQWNRDGLPIPAASGPVARTTEVDLDGNITTTAATDPTYTVTEADVGAFLTCTVTAINAAGDTPVTSNAIGPITNDLSPPANTALPVITGSLVVGGTLTSTDGEWSGNPPPTIRTTEYLWKRSGNNISYQGPTYVTQAADVGFTITCAVFAENSEGLVGAESLPVGPIT